MKILLASFVVALLVLSTTAYDYINMCGNVDCAKVKCGTVTTDNCDGNVVQTGGFCGCCAACVKVLNGETCATHFLKGSETAVVCGDAYLSIQPSN